MTDHLPELVIHQKFALTTNRYEIRRPAPSGGVGELLATAHQKRLALKERLTFFTDDSEAAPAFSLVARQRLDAGATYDIADGAGRALGTLRKDFGRSLLRSTFHLDADGVGDVGAVTATGRERSALVALLRRFGELPLPVNFDFHSAAGDLVLSSDRAFTLRDRYTVSVPDPGLDWRVAAAVSVSLDALLSR